MKKIKKEKSKKAVKKTVKKAQVEAQVPAVIEKKADLKVVEPKKEKKFKGQEGSIFIDRTLFEASLKVAVSFTESRATLPILSMVRISSTGTKCEIVATDLEKAWSRTLNVKGDKIDRCIPCDLLIKEVSALPADISEVELMFTDNEAGGSVRVNGRCEMFTSHADEFPVIATAEGKETTVKHLADAIKRVILAAGENDTRYTLNSILIDTEKESIIGTDGHRLHHEGIVVAGAKEKLLIPKDTARLMARYLTGDATLIFGKSHFGCELSGGWMVSRLIEGTYPDYENVIPKDNKGKVTFNGKDMLKILEGALPVTSQSVCIILNFNGNITVEAANADRGQYKWTLDGKTSGFESLKVGVNGNYLRDALTAYGQGEVEFKIGDALTPILINGKAVVMPMRI